MFDNDLNTKYMLDRNEQVLFYSGDEYLRRKAAVISEMKKRELCLLIIANPCEEAYGTWLANDTRCSYLLLDTDGRLTVVYGFDCGAGIDFAPHPERRVGGRRIHSLIPGVSYADGVDVDYIYAIYAASRGKKVGVINWHCITKSLCEAVEARMPDIQWVDMRIPVGMIRVVRSDEEKEAIKRTAIMAKRLFEAAPVFIREGRYARDAVRDMLHYAKELGAGRDECSLFIMECGYENGGGALPLPNANMRIMRPDAQRMGPGFRILLMIEMNRYGGIVLDTGRNFSIGEPHPVTQHVFEQTVKAQKYAASLMKPGAIPADIEKAALRYAEELGINMLSWNLLHGMGNTKTEAPDLRDPGTRGLPLAEDMFLLCEPNTCIPYGDPTSPSYSPDNVIVIPNTYLVTPEGARATVDFPDIITVL